MWIQGLLSVNNLQYGNYLHVSWAQDPALTSRDALGGHSTGFWATVFLQFHSFSRLWLVDIMAGYSQEKKRASDTILCAETGISKYSQISFQFSAINKHTGSSRWSFVFKSSVSKILLRTTHFSIYWLENWLSLQSSLSSEPWLFYGGLIWKQGMTSGSLWVHVHKIDNIVVFCAFLKRATLLLCIAM